MNRIIEILTRDKLQTATWALYIALSGSIVPLASNNLLIALIGKIPFLLLGKTLCILTLTLVALSISYALYYKNKNKPNINNFTHIEDPGWFVHKKTGKRFCSKCIFPPDSIESPLSVYKGTKDWICIKCQTKFAPPEGGDSIILDSDDIFA